MIVQQASERQPIPPLRLHHLLVAVAVTSVMMWFAQSVQRHDVVGLSAFIGSGAGVVYCIVTALALTLVGLGVHWRRTGVAFFHQPGHWLLVEQSMGIWIVLVAAFGLLSQPMAGTTNGWPFIALFLVGLNLIVVGISFWVAWRIADTWPWKLFFLIEGVFVIGSFVLPYFLRQLPMLFATLRLGTSLLGFVALLAAAIRDRRSLRNRDWAHWVGVFIRVGSYVIVLVSPFAGLITRAIANW